MAEKWSFILHSQLYRTAQYAIKSAYLLLDFRSQVEAILFC